VYIQGQRKVPILDSFSFLTNILFVYDVLNLIVSGEICCVIGTARTILVLDMTV